MPPERRIEYRVGIHLGDVVEESDGDLMGDGVNIAARLEGVARPGAICLSEDAYRQVKQRLDLKVSDLGPTQLKNIAESIHIYSLEVGQPAEPKPVASSAPAAPASKAHGLRSRWPALAAALAVLVLLAGTYVWRSGVAVQMMGVPVTAPHLSIVVLPFANLSSDPEQDYFADAVTDDLTTDMSHLSDSFVIARNTAFTYKGRAVDVKQIGHDLGVRYALDGSVRRIGEAITINAQLISTETGAHIWADRFEGERSKLGELQVEVVSRLANSLGVELIKAEALRAARERPNNPDAADLAMQGWAVLDRGVSKETTSEAIPFFERALSADAQNVRAMTGLAQALQYRANSLWSSDRDGDIARADETIDRALALQPDNSLAHTVKGAVYFVKRQWGPAIAEAERAIEEDPNNANAHASVGFRKIFLGRAEDGFAGVEQAIRLSPRDPLIAEWQFQLCHLHSHLGQWDEAIAWCQRSITSNPKMFWALIDLSAAYAWEGRDKEAQEAVARLEKVHPGFTVQAWAGIHWSDDPTFNIQYARITEGLRKAGVPEGQAKTN